MGKLQKRELIFAIIIIQSLISILGGLVLYSFTAQGKIPEGVHVNGVNIGGMFRGDAVSELKRNFRDMPETGFINLSFDGVDFKLPYSDIDARIDYISTIDQLYGRNGGERVSEAIGGPFRLQGKKAVLVFKIDEDKLRNKLIEFSKLIDRPSKNAHVRVRDGKVEITREVNGRRLNIEKALVRIRRDMGAYINSTLVFVKAANHEVEELVPEYTRDTIRDYEEVLASYTTEVKAAEFEDSIRRAAYYINEVFILAENTVNKGERDVFSFNKCLGEYDAVSDEEDQGYNQVASTLYAAVLKAGIGIDSINRVKHQIPAEYIEPGLDVRVLGSKIDFQFKNTLKHNIIIVTEVDKGKLTVSIVGKKEDKKPQKKLSAQIVQRFKPSVIQVDNKSLEPGQKRVVSEGIEGILVEVLIEGKPLYSDKYDAIKAIVEVGTGAKASDRIDK